MGRDELGTARTLREHRKVTDALVEKHGGRLVKSTGDGLLLEFSSVVDAVECAVAIQAVMSQRNEGVPSERQMLFRIGINLGDILIDGDDILGDGVNVAARLEGIAEPGGICLSSSAYDHVRSKLAVEFIDLGEQMLKNIERPVRVYAALAEHTQVGVPARHAQQQLSLPDKPSIAVLPFQNMSNDPEQEYFADGTVEDIITALSRFKSLFVIARNSSFTYKGRSVDFKQVGRQLGVRYVLEGSVRKAGGKVRITGQLIEAATGAHLWAERFDGRLDDIFELQDKVTSSVVAAIMPRLEQAEIDRSERKPTENLHAFDLYYRAIHSLRRFTREGNEDALRLAQRAISLYPNFAAAYGIALACYTQRGDEQHWLNEDDIAQGRQYAVRAVEVGAEDAFALARAAQFFNLVLKDPITAEAIVDRAVGINPNFSEAWRVRGWISHSLGQHEAALEQFEYAKRLNPLDPQIHYLENGLARANFLLGRFETALSWANKSMARQKNYDPALAVAMVSYAMVGRIADAQMLLARRRDAGVPMTIPDVRKRLAHFRREDLELWVEACRIAGVPE
jgi:adenylate cyclase